MKNNCFAQLIFIRLILAVGLTAGNSMNILAQTHEPKNNTHTPCLDTHKASSPTRGHKNTHVQKRSTSSKHNTDKQTILERTQKACVSLVHSLKAHRIVAGTTAFLTGAGITAYYLFKKSDNHNSDASQKLVFPTLTATSGKIRHSDKVQRLTDAAKTGISNNNTEIESINFSDSKNHQHQAAQKTVNNETHQQLALSKSTINTPAHTSENNTEEKEQTSQKHTLNGNPETNTPNQNNNDNQKTHKKQPSKEQIELTTLYPRSNVYNPDVMRRYDARIISIEQVQTLLDNGADIHCLAEPIDPTERVSIAMLAAIKNDTEVIDLFLKHEKQREKNTPEKQQSKNTTKKLLSEVDTYGNSLLIRAAHNGSSDVVKRLLDAKAEYNAHNRYGDTALYLAASQGHTECVRLLLEAGADCNLQVYSQRKRETVYMHAHKQDPNDPESYYTETKTKKQVVSTSPLSIAAYYGYTDIVQLLIDHKADIELRDRSDHTPLWRAVEQEKADVVQQLINAGANIEAKGHGNMTPLSLAACRYHSKIATMLLVANADLYAQDTSNKIALMHAQEHKPDKFIPFMIEVIQLLAEHEQQYQDGTLQRILSAVDENGLNLLMMASGYGSAKLTELLIKAGADLDTQDLEGNTALMWAISEEHQEVAQLLIEAKASIEIPDEKGNTPLLWAAKERLETSITQLLAAKANVNAQDTNGNTALIKASKEGHGNVVQTLLNAKADLEIESKDGDHDEHTALMHAAGEGHDDIVQKLINGKANINAQCCRGHGCTSLMIAAYNNHNRCAQHLIAAKANVDTQDEGGDTALIAAAYQGHSNAVQQLLNAKANPDAQNKHGDSALTWAAHQGHSGIVQQLLDAKANLDLPGADGSTPLMIAVQQVHNAIAQQLLEAKANPEIPDSNDNTPLQWAEKEGNAEAVTQLLNAHANNPSHISGVIGIPALMTAAKQQDGDMVQQLINENANVNEQIMSGYTALTSAAIRDNSTILQALLDAKADPNVRYDDDETALFWTIHSFRSDNTDAQLHNAQLLVNAKANLAIKDNHQKTALMWAQELKQNALAQLLITAENQQREVPNAGAAEK